ncbi:MAG: glycosyltransferase family 4 protein [Candidatus Delongbacteria bacterium]|nr:glycosyltransferase family 4 protein [Candidatus Delongbacteria bacterium]
MQYQKFRILHLLSQRPDSTGSGFYVQAMLKESEAKAHDNYLFAGLHSNDVPEINTVSDDKKEFVHFNGNDISYQIVGMSDVMPYESRKFCDLTEAELDEYESVFRNRIENIIDKFRPDIIHSHHLWLLTSLVKRSFTNIPVVASCHGSDIRQFRKCVHLRERVLNGCKDLEGVLALSNIQKNEIIKLYGFSADKVHVVGAGFNEELFSVSEKPDPDPIQIVYAGKLSRSKGVPWMLKAFSRIKEINWKLHLVGSGSGKEKEECLELSKELKENVVIHGAVHQHELALIMKHSHIFILPSFYEGLPLVVLEALASGCRVIATDLPGIREISKHIEKQNLNMVKTPRLHSVDTPFSEDEEDFVSNLKKSIISAIKSVTDTPVVKEKGINLFTWISVFEKVEAVYKKVLTIS